MTADGDLLTPPATSDILRGVTRQTLLRIAAEEGLKFAERRFTVDEAKAAREAFTTSATSFVTPVVQIDETVIANGAPGSLSQRLLDWYLDYCDGLKAPA